jgi:hypothetical protein
MLGDGEDKGGDGKKMPWKNGSHPECNTGKFRNRPIAFMNQDPVRIARTIVRNPPCNRDQFPFCRCNVMDAHRDRNAVDPAAVRGYPECLVSEREDGAPMGNAARVHLTGAVHGDTGIPFRCLKDLHLQEPGKLAAVKHADLFFDRRFIQSPGTFIGHGNRDKEK